MKMAVLKIGGKLLSNLFSKPATLDYPATPREYPERTRGHVEFDNSNCILCNICGRKCPTGAIHADKKARTITIDRMNCIQCNYCVDSCPKKCLSMANTYTEPSPTKTTDVFTVPERPKPEPKPAAAKPAEAKAEAKKE